MKNLLALLSCLVVTSAFASNNPADNCYGKAELYSNGPAVVANAYSGCSGNYVVIGYKSNGIFSHLNTVEAIVKPLCAFATEPGVTTLGRGTTAVIKLGKEWHGKGHLSSAIDLSCYLEGIRGELFGVSIAFSDGHNHWDSRFGDNYRFFFESDDKQVLNSRTVMYSSDLNLPIWDFIVRQMY